VLDLQQFVVPDSNWQQHPCKRSDLSFSDPQLEDLLQRADLCKIQVHDETLQRSHNREEKGKGKFKAEQRSAADKQKSGHASSGLRMAKFKPVWHRYLMSPQDPPKLQSTQEQHLPEHLLPVQIGLWEVLSSTQRKDAGTVWKESVSGTNQMSIQDSP
jgi:hypothetical protein